MALRKICLAVLVLLVSACSYGEPFTNQSVPVQPTAQVYRPLQEGSCWVLMTSFASATVIAPGYAVTNAHASETIKSPYIETPYLDLAVFKITNGVVPPTAVVENNSAVVQYGTGCFGDTRIAFGKVFSTDVANCYGHMPTANLYCQKQGLGAGRGFLIESNAGPGFSGGPVYNMRGQLVGVTQGLMTINGKEYSFAYRIEDVYASFAPVINSPDNAIWTNPWWISPKFLIGILII